MKDNFLIIRDFRNGWQVKEDQTRIPIGAAQKSVNITLTDRGGIAPRPGELLLGTSNTTSSGVTSMYSFNKVFGPRILLKSFADRLEYFSNNSLDWELLNDGYTPDLAFGYREDMINVDSTDQLYFGNGVEPYSRWCGYETVLTANLVGGETIVPVATTLVDQVFWSGTAASVTTTSITIANNEWATDVWTLYYVRITSGAASGEVRLIESTTENTITFPTIAGLAGTPTFEMRRLALPLPYFQGTATSVTTTTLTDTGPWIVGLWVESYLVITSGTFAGTVRKITDNTSTVLTFATIPGFSGTPDFVIQTNGGGPQTPQIIYGGLKTDYTDITRDDEITVVSAAPGTIDMPVTAVPETFPKDPKGNILEIQDSAVLIAGQPAAPTTVSKSWSDDATDFTFGSPRAATEGDIQFFPFGGYAISDIKSQEDTVYVIKIDSIQTYRYNDDGAIANVESLKQGANVGTAARAWRMDDDIAFATPDKTITTIGRIKLRDVRPQSTDLAYTIRRAARRYNFDSVLGEEFTNRAFVSVKSNDAVERNDLMIVRNKDYANWEGTWLIGASAIVAHNNKIYYGSSYSPDVYEFLVGVNRVRGSDVFPMTALWESGNINKTGSGFYLNEISSLAVEGYISSNTTIRFKLRKDFANTEFVERVLIGTETQFQDGTPTFSFLGGDPLALEPLGASAIIGDPDENNMRHFIVVFDYPITQVDYVSVEVSSDGIAQQYEVIALGINATMVNFEDQAAIKN